MPPLPKPHRRDASEALVADDLCDEAAVLGAQPLELGLERARGDGDLLREDGDGERQRVASQPYGAWGASAPRRATRRASFV